MLHPVMHPPDLRGERTRISVSLMVCQTVDVYILLGDCNARIGSREQEDDPWDMVRRPNGITSVNDSGKELLNFLNTHQNHLVGTRRETSICPLGTS